MIDAKEMLAWEEYQRAKKAMHEAEEEARRANDRLVAARAAWKAATGVTDPKDFYSSTDSTTDVAYGGNHPWEGKK